MTSELLTTAQIAELWGKSQRWVQNLIKNDRLKATWIGNIRVVRLRDVEAFVHRGRGQPKKNNGVARNGKRRKK